MQVTRRGQYDFDLFVVSNDLTEDEIIIEYERLTPFQATLSTRNHNRILHPFHPDVVGIVVDSSEFVLDGLNCVRSCPQREGFITGINFDTPPSCIYCDPTLF